MFMAFSLFKGLTFDRLMLYYTDNKERNKGMNIKIENPYGEHGEIMTLYRDNVEMANVKISNDCPDTLSDYLLEFGVSDSGYSLGITQPGYLGNEPDFDNYTNIIWIVK